MKNRTLLSRCPFKTLGGLPKTAQRGEFIGANEFDFEISREEVPSGLMELVGDHYIILDGKFEVPVGELTTLYWKGPDGKKEDPAAIVRFTGYEFLPNGLRFATVIKYSVENFV